MSELAFNINGEPFEVPATATGWRVRRLKQKGAPEVVYGRDGLPLVLSIEAGLDELRAESNTPGRYRLDPVDDASKPIANAPAGYVFLHAEARNAESAPVMLPAATDSVVIEAMRMNAEIARSVVDRFPQMVEAAATLLRAADGAGLPKREPRDIELEDDEEEAPAAPTGSPSFEMLNTLVAHVIPMVMAGFAGKKINLGNALDWRKAAAAGEKERAEKPALETGVVQQSATTATTAADALPPLDPKVMMHFVAIQNALKPDEAALAKQIAAELSPVELRAWIDEMSQLDVPQAVQKIRTLLAGNTEAVP